MSRKKKRAKSSTRELIGIEGITGDSLATAHGELALFAVKPTNLSVSSPEVVGARIYAMTTVLKGLPELELLALDAMESYEDNKRYYRQRAQTETLPAVARLLERDAEHLNRLQAGMATAREFYFLARLRNVREGDRGVALTTIHKGLEDQGFRVRQAGADDLKRLLAVYFEQNVTTEKYQDADGGQWLLSGEEGGI